ncbi:MAG TPA: chloride channel protein [Tepidisphaeraceae bacterium]|jgi:CIC family chloride channel protein|nr:chloride channel protein [Tepidisphaeraceae bacterium]
MGTNVSPPKRHVATWVKWLRTESWRNLLVLSVVVGIVAGLGAIVFIVLQEQIDRVAMQGAAGYVMPRPGAEGSTTHASAPARRWLLLLIPALGGLVSGVLVFSIAPEAEGHGTDSVVKSFHRNGGLIRPRVPLVKLVASAVTIGTGGCAGREGPIGQIGAGFGSTLALWLKIGERERRLLMLAGAGAGIGAVFRAPLGGALFVAEVLYRDMEFESAALVPAFVASIVAYSLYCGLEGVWGPIFRVPQLQFTHPLELPLYLVFGVLCAGAGVLYAKVFYGLRDVFRRLRMPPHFKPALGGLALGVLGFFLPEALGMGYGWVQMAIDGTLPFRLALALVFAKMVATGLTIGSGGSGGVFAPSVVIGGTLGAVAGIFFHRLMPNVVTQPSVFVLVGMGAFFAGVARVPVSSLVMVSEMTMGYGLLVPLMLANAVAFLLTPKRDTIYEEQVDSRVDSGAHEGEFAMDVLGRITVAEALPKRQEELAVFKPNTPLPEVLRTIAEGRQQVFPIVNDDLSLSGMIDLHDVRAFLADHAIPPGLLVASDLQAPAFRVLTPEEDLASALRKIHATGLPELPVVESANSHKLLGMLGRRDIIGAYHDYAYRTAIG